MEIDYSAFLDKYANYAYNIYSLKNRYQSFEVFLSYCEAIAGRKFQIILSLFLVHRKIILNMKVSTIVF